MEDESQRAEMNAAIRAQRERGAVPRSMLPPEDDPAAPSPSSPPAAEPPAPEPPSEPEPPGRGLLGRLFGR